VRAGRGTRAVHALGMLHWIGAWEEKGNALYANPLDMPEHA